MFQKRVCTLSAVVVICALTASAYAFERNELVIWVGGDKAHNGIRKVAEKFTRDFDFLNVKVETPEGLTDRFQKVAATGSGPDIVFWAHDVYGQWARSGLIAPIDPSPNVKSSIDAIGWDAVTIGGKIYGYPVSMEAISLIYNKDILKEPPKTYEEMFALNDKLKNRFPPGLDEKDRKDEKNKGITTIMWDQVQPYFTMPLLAADGGYVFNKTATGYDVKDTGVNNKGAMAGAKMLVDLIEKGVTPRGVDYGVMESTFNRQKVAMMVSGPWAWANLDKSKINYGVAKLPSINKKPARAFVGVWGAALNNASPNKALAKEFIEGYLLKEEGLHTMNNDVPLGAVANLKFMKQLENDPRIAATYENVKAGLIMPNVPEMGKFWSAMEAALRNITSGRQKYDIALNDAAKLIVN